MMIKLLLPPNGSINITPKSAFVLYLELKMHFLGKYDVIHYNWRMSVSDKAYEKRKDKFYFNKLSSKYTLRQLTYLYVSILSSNQDAWIGDISESVASYGEFLHRLKTMSDVFSTDLKNIYLFYKKMGLNNFRDLFTYDVENNTSYIFKLLQSKIISTETFLLIDSMFDIINEHDKHNNIVWMSYSTRLKAYRKLIVINKDEAKQCFIQTLKTASN